MSTEDRWTRALNLAETRQGTSTVVLDLASRSAQPVLLDGTANDVWELVSGRSTGEIVDTLATRYGVGPSEIHEPVQAFLAQLLDLGLIRR